MRSATLDFFAAARGNGATWVVATEDGGSRDSARVVVRQRAARVTGVGVAVCRSYFAGLDYAFSQKHLAGLTDFFRRLAAHGIVPDGSLQFLQVA